MTRFWGAVLSTAWMVAVFPAGLMIGEVATADYASAVNALAPDHYYQLDETMVGSVVDAGAAPIHGVHAGSFGGGGAGKVGIAGVSLPGFAGDNKAMLANDAGAIRLGPTASFAGDTMTVALWFKNANPTGLGLSADRLFANNDAGSPLTVAHSANGGIHIATATAEASGKQIAPTNLWLMNNAWHHLVVVRNGNDAANTAVYVDGVNRSSLLSEDPWPWPNSGESAWIAARDVAMGAGLANGAVDEVAIWNDRALTEGPDSGNLRRGRRRGADLYRLCRRRSRRPSESRTIGSRRRRALVAGDAVRNWVHADSVTTTLGVGTAGHSSPYPNSVPTFAAPGPRPSDSIAGQTLGGVDGGNRAAAFFGVFEDDTADMIQIGANPAWLSEEKTYSLLFKTDKSDRYMRLIVNDSVNGQSNDDLYLVMDAGKLVLVGRHGSLGPVADTTETYNDDQWHHVVAVRAGDTWTDLRLYVDGEQVVLNDRTDLGESWSTALSGRIGAQSTTTSGFRGLLDEVAIWDRALTNAESLALFDSLVGDTSPSMLGDANGDGRVDDTDASILAAHWQQS